MMEEKVSSSCQWLMFANWKRYGCFQNKIKFINALCSIAVAFLEN